MRKKYWKLLEITGWNAPGAGEHSWVGEGESFCDLQTKQAELISLIVGFEMADLEFSGGSRGRERVGRAFETKHELKGNVSFNDFCKVDIAVQLSEGHQFWSEFYIYLLIQHYLTCNVRYNDDSLVLSDSSR